MKYQVIFIGGLTNGKILLDYINKDKQTNVELVITYPKNYKLPRSTDFNENQYKNIVYDINPDKFLFNIKNIKPHFIFVCGWSFRISKKILSISIGLNAGSYVKVFSFL